MFEGWRALVIELSVEFGSSLSGRASRAATAVARKCLKVAKCAFGREGAGIVLLRLRGERFASSGNPLGRFPDENASRASRGPKEASRDRYSGRDRVSGAPRGATGVVCTLARCCAHGVIEGVPPFVNP